MQFVRDKKLLRLAALLKIEHSIIDSGAGSCSMLRLAGSQPVPFPPTSIQRQSGGNAFDFGLVPPGSAPVEQTFTLKNLGRPAITDLSLSLAPGGDAGFMLGAPGSTTLDTYASTTFTVSFASAVSRLGSAPWTSAAGFSVEQDGSTVTDPNPPADNAFYRVAVKAGSF